MNHRENLLSLLRRKGFEYIPPQFGLTPYLVDVYREKTGSDLSYEDFFDMPWRNVPDIKVTDTTGNPIQPESMNYREIVSAYGDRLSFHGYTGTQTVMPFGSPSEVKIAVKECLDTMGPKRGMMVAPTHVLEPEVHWENIIAYVEACRKYSEKKHKTRSTLRPSKAVPKSGDTAGS
ncbi:MAG: uroporphyrinogen decarboxylase family protein [Treponema sp.]|jgi:hypothetical protein|nr:uroporphyrinogen decarboxylase family protein [Treponema sp.]